MPTGGDVAGEGELGGIEGDLAPAEEPTETGDEAQPAGDEPTVEEPEVVEE